MNWDEWIIHWRCSERAPRGSEPTWFVVLLGPDDTDYSIGFPDRERALRCAKATRIAGEFPGAFVVGVMSKDDHRIAAYMWDD